MNVQIIYVLIMITYIQQHTRWLFHMLLWYNYVIKHQEAFLFFKLSYVLWLWLRHISTHSYSYIYKACSSFGHNLFILHWFLIILSSSKYDTFMTSVSSMGWRGLSLTAYEWQNSMLKPMDLVQPWSIEGFHLTNLLFFNSISLIISIGTLGPIRFTMLTSFFPCRHMRKVFSKIYLGMF